MNPDNGNAFPEDPGVEELLAILERANLFLTGAAGTGKSWLTGRIIDAYRQAERGVVALGSTGVSAVNIGGVTVHSFFVLGICNGFEELKEHDRRNKKRLADLKRLLKATELIVIDEISMIGVETLEMIRYRLESLGYEGRLMFVGDFYQLPPVTREPSAPVGLFGEALYAFESGAWTSFAPQVVELKRMKRTRDVEFARILSRIRRGERDRELTEYLLELCNNDAVLERDPTWLYGRNREVEEMNAASLARLEGEEYLFYAELEKEKPLHSKRLESWIRLLPVRESLHLKVGAPVLFTVNRWGRYVNGERGVLRTVEEEFLIVEKEGEFVRVEPHEFVLGEPEIDEEGRLQMRPVATLKQFPLRLAYAVTIHKSQGMSIDRLVCNVDTIFVPSQFYVALSRATDPRHLRIDFNRGDLERYLERVIRVDERVREFYAGIGNGGGMG
jgi:ATP-dependent exoDNAse (exonuclease V) alpha subunit